MRCREAVRCTLAAMVLWIAPAAMAQGMSSIINQTMDQPAKIQFDSVLPEAMNVISRATGVRVEAEQAVWDLLPWGQQTNINARIENQTLRQAMDVITRKLGLTYVVRDDAVVLQPMPALRRIGRRATIDELQALDLLTSQALETKVDRPTVREVVDAVDARLSALKSPFALDYRPGEAVRPDKTIFVPRNATLADALESIAQDTGLTWYPSGKSVMVVTKEQQVRNQLAKTITMRFSGVDLAQVLSELSQRAGVRFEFEPGAVQRVPRETRNIQLMLDNTPISQALETICGFTGLGFVVTPRGVYIWYQAYDALAGQRDRAIGMMTLPDSGIQVLIFESQVPADMKEYFKMRREGELEKIRQMMLEQGFRPTTGPSETPAEPAAVDHDL